MNVFATFVTGKLAPAKVVAPVPPEPIAKVADSPAAVPVVFWLSVGNVQFVKVPLAGVPKGPPVYKALSAG